MSSPSVGYLRDAVPDFIDADVELEGVVDDTETATVIVRDDGEEYRFDIDLGVWYDNSYNEFARRQLVFGIQDVLQRTVLN